VQTMKRLGSVFALVAGLLLVQNAHAGGVQFRGIFWTHWNGGYWCNTAQQLYCSDDGSYQMGQYARGQIEGKLIASGGNQLTWAYDGGGDWDNYENGFNAQAGGFGYAVMDWTNHNNPGARVWRTWLMSNSRVYKATRDGDDAPVMDGGFADLMNFYDLVSIANNNQPFDGIFSFSVDCCAEWGTGEFGGLGGPAPDDMANPGDLNPDDPAFVD
jgi:hypothetical protein